MNKLIKLLCLTFLFLSQQTIANELPSWGMTENQYKLPNFANKMSEIGEVAEKNNWQLKVTAPADWHSTIRSALTKMGERDVQMSFKDSVYKSISISAAPGAKIAKISPSTTNTTVQKQVVIDKPQIDTEVDAPDFGDTSFESNKEELLENLAEIELKVPTVQSAPVKTIKSEPTPTASNNPAQIAATKPAEVSSPVTQPPVVNAPVTPTPASDVNNVVENIEENKEVLRKRHARTKRVDKKLSYANIKSKDELFIKGSVVLVKRFINQGVVLYFWMKEAYDPTVHKLVEKGSGKYQKDPEAVKGDTPGKKVVEEKEIAPTKLDFVAVDSAIDDQDDLRRENIRNKRVDYTITAEKLKKGDILYVKNQTVLVERRLSQAQSAYYWLLGDTTITKEVERKNDHKFIIK